MLFSVFFIVIVSPFFILDCNLPDPSDVIFLTQQHVYHQKHYLGKSQSQPHN